MPASKSRSAAKAVLLAPVGPIEAWAFQQIAAGNTLSGGVAALLGVLMAVGYVVVQEYDLPYDEEILALIREEATPKETAENVKDVATEASEYASQTEDS